MSTNTLTSRLVVCAVLAVLTACGTVYSAVPDTVVQTVTSGSNTYTLRMTKQNFRGLNFEVLAQNSSGGYDPYDPGEVRTFLGTVDEDVSAVVAGFLRTDGVLRTAIFFDRGGTYYTEGESVVKTNGWATEAFAFPTTPTVTPGHAGSTMYEWGIGYDVDYNNFTKELQSSLADAVECVEVTNVFMALNFMQCGLVKPMVERVIIRTSQQHCPYYGTSGTALLPLLRDEWNNNQSDAMAYCYKAALGTSEIGGGVAYGNGKFTVNDTWGDLEIFYSVGRHELGHNWGVGDYDGGSPEGVTINCGNQYARWCGTGAQDILNHRDNYLLGSGYETNIGTYTAVDISPYASLDAATIGQGALTIIDAVANDHDGNADAIFLTGVFDVVSQNGGLVTLSSGTGPGGRDELQYTPPGVLGFDTFSYQIVDSTGMTQTGRVHIMIDELAIFIYPAEDAVIVGAQIDQFWVDYINSSGDYVEWTVDVAAAADYDLSWRYSLASGDRPLEIKVNGQVVDPSFSFPATGSFGTWDFTASLRVALNVGTNTVRATAIGSSGANIDYLKVTETIDTSGPQAPYFYYDPTDKPFALVGQSYNETLADTANDPDLNETLTFSKLTGPAWLNVASDGTLSGTPISADMGTNVFTVRVIDSTALTADTTLVIEVYQKTGEEIYEAEDAVYVGGIFGDSYGGYTGSGYVDYQNSSGDYVEWTVNASEAGLGSLEFRYALGSGDRPLEIMVNGQVVEPSLSFPSTGSFGTWDYTSILMVTLNAGDNTVQATAIASSGANVDHLKVGFYSTSGEDTTPPTPDPMTWATPPYATGSTSVAMVATTASDISGVEYYFTCTAGGGNDSGWQTSTAYEDTGLTPDTQYTYTVTARDLSTNQNTTAPSTGASATTNAPPDTAPPTPDPMTFATAPYATGSTSVAMVATTASDPSGVEYYFTCTAGGGNDSGWQDSTTYEDTGLTPDTQYTYTVTARDKSPAQNTTAASTAESATTDPFA
ncbi:MAG: CBM35 domain-containing protein, partial [Planctomycetota bacterium]